MFRATVTVSDKSALVEYQQLVRDVPVLAADFMARRVAPALRKLIKGMLGNEPPRPHRKIEWESRKQQKAFFATEGFGGGIPTKRTHKMARGWRLRVVTTPGKPSLSLEHPDDAAEFVFGPLHQQRFHKITGWPNIIKVLPRLQDQASEIVLNEFWDFATGGAVRSVR